RVNYVVEQKMDILDRVVVNHTDPSSTLVVQLCETIGEQNETYFTIITRDSEGRQSYNKDDHIKCDIRTSTGDSLETDLEIEDNEDGSYTVKYTPHRAGLYELKIEVNGQPLDQGPWTVEVIHQYQFKFKFGSSGNGPGQFNYPSDIAVSEKTGTIVVSDFRNRRIQLFNSDGSYLREIGLGTSCTALSFTQVGHIIAVTPDDVNKVRLFAENGSFVQYINSAHLEWLFHISTGKDDCITACDGKKHVVVTSPDGTELLKRFSASEHEESVWCAIYHEEKFFVSDPKASRVGVYDEDGMLLYDIGNEGSGNGELCHPIGVAIDKFSNLIVCDTGNSRVQVFSLDGKFVSTIGQFSFQPICVAVSSNGEIFLTGFGTNSVHVFH
ncbi:protein lin-41-like, partial [Stylophora pistillata]|uniref:protein lin-41-like n=1 Tax=Stylophora pistillata TaxID=50429 RepID=UPI000C054C1E